MMNDMQPLMPALMPPPMPPPPPLYHYANAVDASLMQRLTKKKYAAPTIARFNATDARQTTLMPTIISLSLPPHSCHHPAPHPAAAHHALSSSLEGGIRPWSDDRFWPPLPPGRARAATLTSFWTISRALLGSTSRAPCAILYVVPNDDRVLIGGWNPML